MSGLHRAALLGMLLLVALAVAGPWLAPWDPTEVALGRRLQEPSLAHWMGTDHLGRDVFSRILAGARVTLGSVAAALGIILALGIAVGGVAGYVGGRVDALLMRVCDVFLTFPTVVLSLFMVGVLGTGMVNVVIAIGLSHWAWYARIARAQVLAVRERDFILAARMAGAGPWAIFRRHLLPAIAAPLAVLASLDLGHMMLHVAGLSFLGLGVAAPTPEWGVMIGDARQFVWTAPWQMVWPGVALFVSVMVCNIAGDALRDRLDPAVRAGVRE
ncbi:nickel ABC transporter permease subunit NikC [Verticiella sediminum]|uniref:Nickel ABC transporter permease subunit NikC n=2 Tax=Verticiella sediminum TaxID=1247510 RepID=A0A556B1K9_9BURK|nr:nickel ABC transporter permease subunit NikC [Verticiella sediminum]